MVLLLRDNDCERGCGSYAAGGAREARRIVAVVATVKMGTSSTMATTCSGATSAGATTGRSTPEVHIAQTFGLVPLLLKSGCECTSGSAPNQSASASTNSGA